MPTLALGRALQSQVLFFAVFAAIFSACLMVLIWPVRLIYRAVFGKKLNTKASASREVFHSNTRAWSGDHCVDPSVVPGVLFCNRPLMTESPRLLDIGPTVLKMFGIEAPTYMDGKALEIGERSKQLAATC